ncbi:MAG: GNAT family N-acetyltransferase [Solirubrobacterales bacterium]|nr:GNAT family N-acetyltransferase [Solirubrobacterales bacterium]
MTLRTVEDTLREAVLELAPGPGEARFSGVAADTLPAAERHPTRHAVAIFRGECPVGFLALDEADPICAYTRPRPSVALRAFFVDARHQEQGIATRAIRRLVPFVLAHHPRAEAIVLTVNVANPVAAGLYRRAGFLDTGRIHVGGPTGPQHVLVRPLADG